MAELKITQTRGTVGARWKQRESLRSLGLQASGFFWVFLDFYNLQPHHLTPNMVVLLSAFVTLCEGFLGVLPTLEL